MEHSNATIPMCWKCSNKIVREIGTDEIGHMFIGTSGSYKLVGCKASDKVTNYETARTHCPLLGQK